MRLGRPREELSLVAEINLEGEGFR
jgi:hypothetical protein